MFNDDIRITANFMASIMVLIFALNDVPHAMGLPGSVSDTKRYAVKMSHYIPLRTQTYPPFGTVYGTGKTEYKTEYVTAKDKQEARQKVYVPYGWRIDAVY